MAAAASVRPTTTAMTLVSLLLALLSCCVVASPSAAAASAAAAPALSGADCAFAHLHVHAISHDAAASMEAEAPDTTHFVVAHIHTFWNQPVHVSRRNESANHDEEDADAASSLLSLSAHHALSASEEQSVLSAIFDVCCDGVCSTPHVAHTHAIAAALPMHAHHIPSQLHASLHGPDTPASLDHWLNARNVLRRQWVPSSLLAPPPNELGFVFVARLSDDAWDRHSDGMEQPAELKVQCSVRMDEEKAKELGVTLTNMQGTPLVFEPMQMTCDAAGSRAAAAHADDAAWAEHDGALDFSAAHEQQHDEIDIFVDIESVRAGEIKQHEAAATAQRISEEQAEVTAATAAAEQTAADVIDKTVMHIYYERQLSLHHARHAAESDAADSGASAGAPKLDGSDGFDPWFDPHFLSSESDLVPHLIFESRPDLFAANLPPIVHHHSRGYFVDAHHLPLHANGDRRMVVEVQLAGEVDRMGRNKTKLMRLPFMHPDEHHFNAPGEQEHEEDEDENEPADAHLFVLHHELLSDEDDDFETPSHLSAHTLVEVATDRSPLVDGSSWPAHMQRDVLAFLEFGAEVAVGAHSEAEDPTPILSPAQQDLSNYLSSALGFDALGSPVKIDGVLPLVDSPLSPLKLLRPECLQEEMDSAMREAREQWMDRMDAHKAVVDSKRLANVRARMQAAGRAAGPLPIVLQSPLIRRRLSPMAGAVVTPGLMADALKDRSVAHPSPAYVPPPFTLPRPAPEKEPHWKKQQREDQAKEKAAKAKAAKAAKKKGKKAGAKKGKKAGGKKKGGKKAGGKKAGGKKGGKKASGGKKKGGAKKAGKGKGKGKGKAKAKGAGKKAAAAKKKGGRGKKRRFLQLHMDTAAESLSASRLGAGVGVDGSHTVPESDREPHQVDEVINDYEDCDLEAPFKNPTCPLPTFLHILPNLMIKIAVCVLIPPVLDEFAEEYMKGQAPSLKIWNNLLLQIDERVTQGLSEDSIEAVTATPPAAQPRLGSAGRAPTPFDRERAYNVMADHIAAHYFNDFMAESREKVQRNLPEQSFHRAAARAASNVDSGMLLDPARKPLAMVFHEEFTRLLEQNGLVHQDLMSTAATATDAAGMETAQSPRAAGGEGGGAEYGEIMRGKKLVVTIKGGLFSALQTPIVQNLAKQVTVGVTGQVVPAVYDALTDILRDELPDAVRHSVMHTAGNAAGLAVGVTVAESVERLLPLVPIRQLTQGLTHMLTRSVSHALSSTLLHSLGSTPLRDYYCYYCMYYSYGCTQCHEHNRSSMRYALTYGYFYSSYFGDYYADHYAEQIYTIMGKDRSA